MKKWFSIKFFVILCTGLILVTALPIRSLGQDTTFKQLAQTCPISQRGESESCPLPIRFTMGSYGVLINDRLTKTPQVRYYSFTATHRQRLTLSFAGKGPLRAGITFPGGSDGDGPFNGKGNTITLPTTGIYIIYIGQNTMSGDPWMGNFTMALIVQ